MSCAYIMFALIVLNNMHVSFFMLVGQSAQVCLVFEVHVHVDVIICFFPWCVLSMKGVVDYLNDEYISLQYKYLYFWVLQCSLTKNLEYLIHWMIDLCDWCWRSLCYRYCVEVLFIMGFVYVNIVFFQSLRLLIWMRGLLRRKHQWMIHMFLSLMSQVWVAFQKTCQISHNLFVYCT